MILREFISQNIKEKKVYRDLKLNNCLKSNMPKVDLSIVVSCHYEEDSIELFHQRLSETLASMDKSYELIFINDGSTDRTFEKLKAIFHRDASVAAIVDLFQNVGQSNAVTPGIMLARGRAILNMDSDLQLYPEDIPMLVDKFDEGYDMVTGYRRNRRDSLFRIIPSFAANVIMRRASKTKLRDFGCTFKIWNSALVAAFKFGPFKPWRPVPVIARAGRIAEIPVRHQKRAFGKSGWTFKKLFLYNMENMVNVSEMIFQFVGILCFFLASLFVGRILLDLFFPFSIFPEVTEGLLLNAIVIAFLGIVSVLAAIGEFVIRNFHILQRMPAFVVREILTRNPPGKNATDGDPLSDGPTPR